METEIPMCHESAGKEAAQMNTHCGCGCSCPVTLSTGDEIKELEAHKKIFQDRIEMIDTKLAGLKTVNKP